LYKSSYIVTAAKSRQLRSAVLMTNMEDTRNDYIILMGIPLGKSSLGGLRTIILIWIIGSYSVRVHLLQWRY